LRELNLASLPPDKEAAQCKQVAAQIGKHLTAARNALKTQVCIVYMAPGFNHDLLDST
jgi:hypothetical protein